MTDTTNTPTIEDDEKARAEFEAGLQEEAQEEARVAARVASYAGQETPDRVAELENRLVPGWPSPVTDDHFELLAAQGMANVEFVAKSLTTADLAFWLIMQARLGRFPTYEELKTMLFRIEAAGQPVPEMLKRAMSVYQI
jgi:hypothetical protein